MIVNNLKTNDFHNLQIEIVFESPFLFFKKGNEDAAAIKIYNFY